ncbi:hypothetical protein [Halalkalicoccus sp. NIPERK01]|uniref:hypothetical protein n=1 Tax=Halalkalicoccus sp. NIPERK01 TaxID=3053469 RepID=UPI00256F63AB|nr:hypothetical protein [Halalkalicoccus sp. NIPERK01]MDL5361187.1 hypothetical protein [Halalkalicoccus sp. NIPERK01]
MSDTETCAEDDCDRAAAVRLHIPWKENRNVCTAHARTLAQQAGVVAEPLDDADWE